MNTRQCYMGAERIRDVVNSYDTETYHLPYYYENKFFCLSYETGTGITSFIDRRTGKEMLGCGEAPFFTPMYEVTRVRKDLAGGSCPEEWERRIMGRNIRGTHAELYKGQLKEIEVQERGKVFTELRLKYALEGTVHADVILKFYADMPRIDFRLELGKTISSDIESIFLPMSLNFENNSLYLKKGAETFRPGVDQLPGTCMEYYASDEGIVYQSSNRGALLTASLWRQCFLFRCF